MKKGDIRMIFGNPHKCTNPQGQAKLIKKLEDHVELEEWQVEFINQPDHYYNVLIKKI